MPRAATVAASGSKYIQRPDIWMGVLQSGTNPPTGDGQAVRPFSQSSFYLSKVDLQGFTLPDLAVDDYVRLVSVRTEDQYQRVMDIRGKISSVNDQSTYWSIAVTGGYYDMAQASDDGGIFLFQKFTEAEFQLLPAPFFYQDLYVYLTPGVIGMLGSGMDNYGGPYPADEFVVASGDLGLNKLGPYMLQEMEHTERWTTFSNGAVFPPISAYTAEAASYTLNPQGNYVLSATSWNPEAPPKLENTEKGDRLVMIEPEPDVLDKASVTMSKLGTPGSASYKNLHIQEDSTGRLWAAGNVLASGNYDLGFFYSDDNGETWTQNGNMTIDTSGLGYPQAEEIKFYIDKNTDTALLTMVDNSTQWRYIDGITSTSSWTQFTGVSTGWNSTWIDAIIVPNTASSPGDYTMRIAAVQNDNNGYVRLYTWKIDTTQSPWNGVAEISNLSLHTGGSSASHLEWKHDGHGYLVDHPDLYVIYNTSTSPRSLQVYEIAFSTTSDGGWPTSDIYGYSTWGSNQEPDWDEMSQSVAWDGSDLWVVDQWYDALDTNYSSVVLLKWTPGSGTFTKYVCPHFLAIPDNLDRSGLEMVYSDVHDQLLIMVPTISYGHITTDGALMVPFDCASATWGVPVPWFNMGQANTSSANYTDIASMRRLTDDGTYALLLFSANLSQLVGSHVWTITVPAAQITL